MLSHAYADPEVVLVLYFQLIKGMENSPQGNWHVTGHFDRTNEYSQNCISPYILHKVLSESLHAMRRKQKIDIQEKQKQACTAVQLQD